MTERTIDRPSTNHARGRWPARPRDSWDEGPPRHAHRRRTPARRRAEVRADEHPSIVLLPNVVRAD